MSTAVKSQHNETTLRAPLVPRLIAKCIDLLIFGMLSALLPTILGPIAGFLYSITADGLHYGPLKGQSIGKYLLGLQVVQVVEGNRPCSYKDSLLRNLPVGIVTLFAILAPWGWILLIFLGIPLTFTEVYLMVRNPHRLRLGDVLADTEVWSMPK